MFARLLSTHKSTLTRTRCERAPAHTPDNGSHSSGWQPRQADYLSPCSRQGKPSNSMLFSLKAAKTVSKHPPLLLTHTNIILHNSAEPDPTVHILLLAVGSVRVITPTGDIYSCNVGLKKYDPALLFTSILVSLSNIHNCHSDLTVLTIMHKNQTWIPFPGFVICDVLWHLTWTGLTVTLHQCWPLEANKVNVPSCLRRRSQPISNNLCLFGSGMIAVISKDASKLVR